MHEFVITDTLYGGYGIEPLENPTAGITSAAGVATGWCSSESSRPAGSPARARTEFRRFPPAGRRGRPCRVLPPPPFPLSSVRPLKAPDSSPDFDLVVGERYCDALHVRGGRGRAPERARERPPRRLTRPARPVPELRGPRHVAKLASSVHPLLEKRALSVGGSRLLILASGPRRDLSRRHGRHQGRVRRRIPAHHANRDGGLPPGGAAAPSILPCRRHPTRRRDWSTGT